MEDEQKIYFTSTAQFLCYFFDSQPISVPSTYNNDARRSSEPHLVPEEPSSPTNIANSLETESPSPPLLPRSVDSPGDTRQEGNFIL